MKKGLLVFMSMMLVMGVLAGCASSKEGAGSNAAKVEVNKEGFPIVDEKITLSLFAPNVGIAKWQDMKYFQEMEKRTNIAFNFNTPPNESFETQKNLLFASNELPDVFYAASLTNSDVTKYSEQGLLIPLDDLIDEYAPNVAAMLEKYPDIKKTITALDGHIYTLPTVNRTSPPWNIHPMWYNGDFLAALNVTELPTTTDELYDLLVRFKTEDPNGNGLPDEIPLTAAEMWDINQWFMGFFGVVARAVGTYDGEVKYGAIQPEYKEYLEYMNKLWKADLFDHEAFSQTGEQKGAKGKKNQVGLFANWGAGSFMGVEESDKHPMMQPVTGPNVSQPVIPISPGQSINQFAISNTNKNPEATMRWIDYSYSPEGSAFIKGLDEGDLWEFTDDTKTKRINLKDLGDKKGTMTPEYGINVPLWADEAYELSFANEYDVFVKNETAEKIVKYGQVAMPQLFLTAEELDQIAGINADLVAYVEQMEAKFITGAIPFSEWDKYVETANKIGVDKVVEVYQTAYDRYAAN
ncbi:extracellular solute-binding protein [Sporosarcina sp. YIM B06819]|uniref:extracellular solute-binding protein n=1 Tax=Sporosarcina sp. YIM B06819 TaxID=3081769 RepID=UPI00298CD6A7|nr:extracellular solute-binding protein [Sporosarcina sp. YIM B06819]